MRFDELKLDKQIMEAISYMGFTETTPIQEKAIPEILNGRDMIGCAQTGTGKTAAFVLPILNNLAVNPTTEVDTLIIVPTRELAIQIEQQIQGFSYFLQVNSLAIYGGGDGSEWGNQKSALSEGTNIIVATPGKLISHLNMGYVQFHKVKHFILDEADRMLDMNFYDDIQKISKHLTGLKQTLMFSATMSSRIRKLAQELLTNPVEISFAVAKPSENVSQSCYHVFEDQKIAVVSEIIKAREDYSRILVFTSTKKKVTSIVRGLQKAKFGVESMSSDLSQNEREEVIVKFRSDKIRVLVATDVLSRGIDIKDINLIINFDVPNEAEDYVHRIGRTARAKTKGEAITLITKDDHYKFQRIEKLIEARVKQVDLPDHVGKSPVFRPGYRPKSFSGNRGNFRHRKGGNSWKKK